MAERPTERECWELLLNWQRQDDFRHVVLSTTGPAHEPFAIDVYDHGTRMSPDQAFQNSHAALWVAVQMVIDGW